MTRNKFTRTTFIIALNLCFIIPAKSQVTTWSQFRGPNCSGIAATDQNPPVKIDTETNLLWKIAVPEGYSSPCIWDNQIFLTGIDRENNELLTICFDRTTGDEIWRQTKTAEQIENVHALSCPANATVATDGEGVYAYFGSCGLICYDLSGREKWDLPMPVPTSTHGMGTSPIVP